MTRYKQKFLLVERRRLMEEKETADRLPNGLGSGVHLSPPFLIFWFFFFFPPSTMKDAQHALTREEAVGRREFWGAHLLVNRKVKVVRGVEVAHRTHVTRWVLLMLLRSSRDASRSCVGGEPWNLFLLLLSHKQLCPPPPPSSSFFSYF